MRNINILSDKSIDPSKVMSAEQLIPQNDDSVEANKINEKNPQLMA